MKKNSLQIDRKLIARKRAETRLKIYGIVSISIALIMLSTLIISIGLSGYSALQQAYVCLLYTSPSPRDRTRSRMPSSA